MKALRMSLLLRRTAATAALILASTGTAQAATAFDQTSPFTVNKTDGNRGDLWSADDFGVSTLSLLSGATAYLGYFRTDGVIPGINYTLYADNGGRPGTILQSGSATPTDTLLGTTGDGNFGWHAWAFNFTAPVQALATTRYWLGLQQGSDRVSIGFIDSGNPNASALTTFAGPAPESYNIGLPRGLAFSIQGSAIGSPGAVPEPATWAMMIVGFGAVGSAMRRRRRTAVSFA